MVCLSPPVLSSVYTCMPLVFVRQVCWSLWSVALRVLNHRRKEVIGLRRGYITKEAKISILFGIEFNYTILIKVYSIFFHSALYCTITVTVQLVLGVYVFNKNLNLKNQILLIIITFDFLKSDFYMTYAWTVYEWGTKKRDRKRAFFWSPVNKVI